MAIYSGVFVTQVASRVEMTYGHHSVRCDEHGD